MQFVAGVLGPLNGNMKLYPTSAGANRVRWDAILVRLGIPKALGFTPASSRAGGTVHTYNSGVSISDLMWRLLLQNLKTLNHYLQEVATATSLREVPPPSRTAIAAAAALYQPLLEAAPSSCGALAPVAPAVLMALPCRCSSRSRRCLVLHPTPATVGFWRVGCCHVTLEIEDVTHRETYWRVCVAA